MVQKELTEVAIASERFVGVESGGYVCRRAICTPKWSYLISTALHNPPTIPTHDTNHRHHHHHHHYHPHSMDQSCSIFGIPSAALLIDFAPTLQVTPVVIPTTNPAPVFVIAHTLVTADKHVTAPVCYNLRVVETRLAAVLLAKALLSGGSGNGSNGSNGSDGNREDCWKEVHHLRAVMERCCDRGLLGGVNMNVDATMDTGPTAERMVAQLEGMLALVERTLTATEGYTREEMAAILGMTVQELHEKYMSKFVVRADTFQLYRRAKHVFSEALRVYQFQRLCQQQSQQQHQQDLLQQLGALMNESQQSCRDLFDCSCPELDQLTALARFVGRWTDRSTDTHDDMTSI